MIIETIKGGGDIHLQPNGGNVYVDGILHLPGVDVNEAIRGLRAKVKDLESRVEALEVLVRELRNK